MAKKKYETKDELKQHMIDLRNLKELQSGLKEKHRKLVKQVKDEENERIQKTIAARANAIKPLVEKRVEEMKKISERRKAAEYKFRDAYDKIVEEARQKMLDKFKEAQREEFEAAEKVSQEFHDKSAVLYEEYKKALEDEQDKKVKALAKVEQENEAEAKQVWDDIQTLESTIREMTKTSEQAA